MRTCGDALLCEAGEEVRCEAWVAQAQQERHSTQISRKFSKFKRRLVAVLSGRSALEDGDQRACGSLYKASPRRCAPPPRLCFSSCGDSSKNARWGLPRY